MSYAKEITEFTDEQLTDELKRRDRCRRSGVCDYCEQPPHTTACRFPDRHVMAIDFKHVINLQNEE